ncbi:MAG TPA: UbiD family decarboxylase [Chloroflexota bacterium]|nr:UbiD family decarboxylase [Chloroflexota bacterium]
MATPVQAAQPAPTAGAAWDLRAWLAAAEQLGQVQRIAAEVDPDLEMSTITYMVGKRVDAPALLFERIRGYPGHRALWNILGSSLDRYALAMGLPPGQDARTLVQLTRERLKHRLPPREVPPETAPVNAHVLTGADADVTRLPAPRHWPLDGGRYLGTADVVITRDPDTGVLNVGTYRMMVHGPRELGLYLSPGKDARLQMARAWARGEPFPVAAAVGIDPLLFIVGSQTFPKNVSEYEHAGGILGAPIEVTRGVATDLLIPARAEIVIEGVVHPGRTRPEGPFGEFTGYYGRPEGEAPLVEVLAIHYRDQPILTNALMADYPACEMAVFFSIAKAARVWDDLDRLGIPGIAGVYAHPAAASGFGMLVVALEQRYAGHAAQVLALAAQCPGAAYYTKWIIAVDEDVDPSNLDEVLWALSTRCSPIDDIDIQRNTWSTWLDPTINPPELRPWGSKALINACKQHRFLHSFARRTRPARAVYERVRARWAELGLPGTPPVLTGLEEDTAPEPAPGRPAGAPSLLDEGGASGTFMM